jgi:uncharacterized protein (DUF433 family)
MSRVISLRLPDEDALKLERWAQRFGRSAGSAAGLLLSEKLREEALPDVDHRSTAGGRVAYVKGTRLPVWLVIELAHRAELDAEGYATSLGWISAARVMAAFDYAAAFPEEIRSQREYAEEFEQRNNPRREPL